MTTPYWSDFVPNSTFYRIWVVSIEHLRRVWHADRGRLLLRTPCPVPLGLACVLLVETNPFPNLPLFYRTMLFVYPSVLSRFCYIVQYKGLFLDWSWSDNFQHSLVSRLILGLVMVRKFPTQSSIGVYSWIYHGPIICYTLLYQVLFLDWSWSDNFLHSLVSRFILELVMVK